MKHTLGVADVQLHPILDKIACTEHLPSLPAVAVRVLELIRQEEVAVTEIGKVVKKAAKSRKTAGWRHF